MEDAQFDYGLKLHVEFTTFTFIVTFTSIVTVTIWKLWISHIYCYLPLESSSNGNGNSKLSQICNSK